jgi:hypothetical protein
MGKAPSQTPPHGLKPPHHPTRSSSSLHWGPLHHTPRARGPPPPPSSSSTTIFEFKVSAPGCSRPVGRPEFPLTGRALYLHPSSPVATPRRPCSYSTQTLYTVISIFNVQRACYSLTSGYSLHAWGFPRFTNLKAKIACSLRQYSKISKSLH